MEKLIILVTSLIFLNSFAQTPTNFKWAVKAGGTGTDESKSVTTDKLGNIYITGYFKNTATFGSLPAVTSAGAHDVFVAKYDSSGNALWVNTIGGTDNDEGYGITTDTVGNVYVTGTFGLTATAGATVLTSAGSFDVFVAKYTSSGVLSWAKSAGGTGSDKAYGITSDILLNIYITGSFGATANFDSQSLTTTGADDIFIVKYNNAGTAQWAKKAGGTSGDAASSISVDNLSNIYITGNYSGTSTFLGTPNVILTSSGSWDAFIAKYDALGNVLWAKKAGGSNADYGTSIATDNAGSSVVSGYYQSTSINFSGQTLTNAGAWDMFVAKYNTSGTLSWVKKYGGTGYDYAYGVTLDKAGKIVLTGGFGNTVAFGGTSLTSTNPSIEDLFVTKIDSAGGNVLWAMKAGAASNQYTWGNDVVTDAGGDIYVTGTFEGTAAFGTSSLVSAGGDETYGEDIYLAKINQDTITTVVNNIKNKSNNITISPTITSDRINISSNSVINNIQVFNISGQMIADFQALVCKKCITSIDVSSFNSGIYFFRIKTNEETFTQKVIVAH